MKKWSSLVSFVLLAVGLQARAQSSVQIPADIPAPAADKAQIVFLKPGGGMWSSLVVGVLDIRDGERTYLGVLEKDARLVVDVEPGKHRFMSHLQGIGHFLDADVEAGKRYFVLARFLYGQGFQLRPVRPGTDTDFSAGHPQFAQWLTGTEARPANARRAAWYGRKTAKLDKIQARTLKTWERKTDAERAELTLRPQDAL